MLHPPRAAALLALILPGCPLPDPAPEPPPARVRLVCDRDYLGVVEDLAGAATERLSITQWELFPGSSTDRVVELLGEAAGRGVRVKVLLDDQIDSNAEGVARLRALGVDAKLDGSSVRIHAKSLHADGRRSLVGSTNWSDSSIERNHECNLLLEDGAPPAYLEAWFDAVWADPWDRDTPGVAQDGSLPVRALVDDDLLPSLLERAGEARERLDFTLYATYLQVSNLDSPAMRLFTALADAAARGVEVRGVADWSDWDPGHNESNQEAVAWLEARGIDMRWEDPDQITHSKVFRVDDWIQVQSANPGTGGFEQNHEVGGATTDAQVLADFDAWWDPLWAQSTDGAPW